MDPRYVGTPFDEFLAAADAAADQRPEVDRDIARELMFEAATMLHNGLAMDGLDEHDTAVVVAALCVDLVSTDPGEAVRDRSRAVQNDPGDVHDPDAVAASLLISASILQL